MIKSLQKRISTLFMFLLTIIWLVILLLFVNNSYRNNLSDLQQTVRAALHYTTWDAFVISNGQTSPSELDHIPYCLFSIDESNEMDIMFDTFSDVSDSYLLNREKLSYPIVRNMYLSGVMSLLIIFAPKKDNIMF